MIGLAAAMLSAPLPGQAPASQPARETPASEFRGLPARAAATEYQAQGKAGAINIGAEFDGHSVPTAEGAYTTDDFVVVEVGMFGAPGARATLSTGDFSLRINGRKNLLPNQPYELVFKSLKDPEWGPPTKEKSKTSVGGGADGSDAPPAPVHMPMELRHAMEQRVQKAVLLEGDRALPQAGLLFFDYRGKAQGIHSVELIYNGPAGNVTIPLHP